MHGRLRHIDGLRGIAACAVVLQHIAILLLDDRPGYALGLSRLVIFGFDSGRFGVTLFFLVSGFVVPASAARASVGCFCVSRLFRLYPVFWLSVIAVAISRPGAPFADVLANLSMAPRLFGVAPFTQVYWTLFVELCFYAILLVLRPFGPEMRPGLMGGIAMTLCAIGVAPALIEKTGVRLPDLGLAFHLSWLFAGGLMRQAGEDGRPSTRRLVATVLACELGGAAVLSGLAFPNDYVVTNPAPLGAFLGYGAAVLVFGYAIRARRPGGRLWPWLGSISYSLYLFHCVIARMLIAVTGASPIGVAAFVLGTVGLSVLLAWLLYRAVERPAVALGRSLLTRPSQGTPPGLAIPAAL